MSGTQKPANILQSRRVSISKRSFFKSPAVAHIRTTKNKNKNKNIISLNNNNKPIHSQIYEVKNTHICIPFYRAHKYMRASDHYHPFILLCLQFFFSVSLLFVPAIRCMCIFVVYSFHKVVGWLDCLFVRLALV